MNHSYWTVTIEQYDMRNDDLVDKIEATLNQKALSAREEDGNVVVDGEWGYEDTPLGIAKDIWEACLADGNGVPAFDSTMRIHYENHDASPTDDGAVLDAIVRDGKVVSFHTSEVSMVPDNPGIWGVPFPESNESVKLRTKPTHEKELADRAYEMYREAVSVYFAKDYAEWYEQEAERGAMRHAERVLIELFGFSEKRADEIYDELYWQAHAPQQYAREASR